MDAVIVLYDVVNVDVVEGDVDVTKVFVGDAVDDIFDIVGVMVLFCWSLVVDIVFCCC